MKDYLQHIIKSLKNYSVGLGKISILINKPWTLVDSENEIQRLIFKKNKELILSKNGQATIGKWDYFPEAKSLLIDRGKDIILCNESYIDDGILVLKLDGTQNNFFILANQNLIPDLNIHNYLMKKRSQHLNIKRVKLLNGKILEVFNGYNTISQRNDFVLMDFDKVTDGIYPFQDGDLELKFIISNSHITSTLTVINYKTKEGKDIVIDRHNQDYNAEGDEVFINAKPAPDGKYKLDGFNKITVKDGKIIRKSVF